VQVQSNYCVVTTLYNFFDVCIETNRPAGAAPGVVDEVRVRGKCPYLLERC